MNTCIVTVGYEIPTTVSTQTKELLFTQKAVTMKKLEDHMVLKNRRISCCSVVLSDDVLFLTCPHTHIDYDQLTTVWKKRSWCKKAENPQYMKYGKSACGLLFNKWKCYRLSRMIVVVPAVITFSMFFCTLNIYLHGVFFKWLPRFLDFNIKRQTFQDLLRIAQAKQMKNKSN